MTAHELHLVVNGADRRLEADVRSTLLEVLRSGLGLPGTKRGCDRGECGACTVLVDDRPALACLTLAAAVDGSRVTTIEATVDPDTPIARLQRAFVEHDALQCGYCTPGQIMAGVACIAAGQAGTEADIRKWMSGNLCRCAAYPQIVAAIRSASAAP